MISACCCVITTIVSAGQRLVNELTRHPAIPRRGGRPVRVQPALLPSVISDRLDYRSLFARLAEHKATNWSGLADPPRRG